MDAKVWSIYGAERSQPVATGKCEAREKSKATGGTGCREFDSLPLRPPSRHTVKCALASHWRTIRPGLLQSRQRAALAHPYEAGDFGNAPSVDGSSRNRISSPTVWWRCRG